MWAPHAADDGLWGFGGHRLRLAAPIAAIALALCATARADGLDPASEPLLARFAAAGVPGEPLAQALRAYACASSQGEFARPILTLIDYSRPSTEPRLWVLDLARGAVQFRTLVAHGRGSGVGRAVAFSNVPGSKQSSLGLFRTEDTYEGEHGYSLRLVGLEAGINDLAYPRNIVIHGADYATAKFASLHGRLGRSWGCPALDPSVNREVIDVIRGGSALFAYYPDASWLASSPYLRCDAAAGPPDHFSRLTTTSSVPSSHLITSSTLSPAARSLFSASSAPSTGLRSTSSITSPTSSPALSPGPPG